MTNPAHFCVQGGEKAQEPYHYTECGLDNIYLSNGFERRKYDGEETVAIRNVDGLWKAIGFHIVTRDKTIEAKEIRFLRSVMTMTQNELAAKLGVDSQTVARWEKGQNDLPGPADRMIRVLFLSAEISQPEGGKIIEKIRDLIDKIHEMDESVELKVHFSFDDKWDDGEKRAAA